QSTCPHNVAPRQPTYHPNRRATLNLIIAPQTKPRRLWHPVLNAMGKGGESPPFLFRKPPGKVSSLWKSPMASKRFSPLLLSLALLSGCGAERSADLLQAAQSQVEQAMTEHRFHDARNKLILIEKATGPSVATAKGLARVALELGDGYAAEYQLNQLRSLSGETSEWIDMRAQSMILQGATSRARDLITRFNGTRPPSDRQAWLLVWAAMEEGKVEEAKEIANSALALYSRSADLHARAGRLMAMRGDWSAVDTHVAAALQADPQHYEALLLQGESKIAKGDLAGALEPYETAAKTYPDFAVPFANIAGLLMVLGRLDEAQKVLASARPKYPDFPLLSFSAARLDAIRGRWPEARATLQALPMAFKRDFAPALLLEAEVEAGLGNHTLARSMYESLASEPRVRDQVAELLKRLPAAS
ncbi:MAG: tetratricopeptide repeat protein, partial [Erythrobacter sp.]